MKTKEEILLDNELILNSQQTRDKFIQSFESTIDSLPMDVKPLEDQYQIDIHFVRGPFVEIKGEGEQEFRVEFWDEDGLNYITTLKPNMWSRPSKKYFSNWEIKVFKNDELFHQHKMNLENKRVFIAFDSSSLGDSIAWFPYVEEFRKKHKCKLIVSTFWNRLFEKSYPDISFVNPGTTVYNIYAMYNLGCFYDSTKEPVLFNTIPLQKVSTNILGLEHTEIKPKVTFKLSKNNRKKKYVTIGYHSTAGLKYWNNPTGWQELVDELNRQGYDVLNLSLDKSGLNNVVELKDKSIDNIMTLLHHSEFFIGLSSGLSWLAWTLNKTVVLISNVTSDDHEFQENCIRISNPSVCNSCWMNPMFKFDKGDWWWCPEHKDTERHFECTKSITSKMVLEKIQHLLK